ncbi:MAG: glycosyltransferase family 4 protein [Rhodothermales bacterium]
MATLFKWADDRFDLSVRWLRCVIRSWKPDVIHSLPLNVGGKLARLALESIPMEERPKWVASAWGSDLYLGVDAPDERENIEYILLHCDAFFADCRRDRQLAVDAGLDKRKLALADAVPGVGGLDLDLFSRIRSSARDRDVIIVPKAFDRPLATRVMPILEALRIADERLEGFEIHLLMCNEAAETWMRRMPESLRRKCRCHPMIPRPELLELMGRARLVVSPSLSDGTPNVMLEAMAAGALPVVSPIDSIQEWVEDGKNGLFARALYPNEIAEAVSRGIADDELFRTAAERNWEIVRRRADRARIREKVLTFYAELIQGGPTAVGDSARETEDTTARDGEFSKRSSSNHASSDDSRASTVLV